MSYCVGEAQFKSLEKYNLNGHQNVDVSYGQHELMAWTTKLRTNLNLNIWTWNKDLNQGFEEITWEMNI